MTAPNGDLLPPPNAEMDSKSDEESIESFDSDSSHTNALEGERSIGNVTKKDAYDNNPFGPAVGRIIGRYRCSYLNAVGTLYATTKAFCFYNKNFFGFEQHRIVIPWCSVSVVEKNDVDVDGIIITSKVFKATRGRPVQQQSVGITDPEKGYFRFIVFSERDAAFGLIKSLHRKATGDLDGDTLSNNAPKPKLATSLDDSDIPTTLSIAPTSSLRRTISMPIPDVTGGYDSDREVDEEDYKAACAIATIANVCNMPSVVSPERQKLLLGKIDESEETEEETVESEEDKKEVGAVEDTLGAWCTLRDSKEPSFKDIALEKVPLACSVEQFYDYFLKDDANYCMASYQRDEIKDTDIETTKWEKSKDPFAQTRTIQYVHPVNNPMAPPCARATKRQELRRYGKHGLCVETRTIVNDVPMTDCFFVEDRLLVEASPEGGILLTAKFEMRFVKKTMFRKIIENTTRGEYMEWFKGYAEMARKAIEKGGDRKEDSGKKQTKDKASDDLIGPWCTLRDSKEPSFKEIALDRAPLSCSIGNFYKYFLKDDAKYSMCAYQRDEIKDTDIETTKWEKKEDPLTETRTTQYVHPVNNPMAPPCARATKSQQLQRFGEHGICLDTKTVVNDVPMTDCFYTEDRLLVEASPEGGILLTAKFEMRFVKKTMFRKIIENTTRGEYIAWYKGYLEMATKAATEIVEDKESTEEVPQPAKTREITREILPATTTAATAPPSPEKPLFMNLLMFLVCILSMSTLFLSYEVYSMKQSMVKIEMHLENIAGNVGSVKKENVLFGVDK